MSRYVWAWGIKSRDAAWEAIEEACANGQVSLAEKPEIEPYRTVQLDTGKVITRFKVTLEDSL